MFMSLYYTLVCVVHICMHIYIFISTHLYAHFIVEEERIEEGTELELTRLQGKTGASQSDSHCTYLRPLYFHSCLVEGTVGLGRSPVIWCVWQRYSLEVEA